MTDANKAIAQAIERAGGVVKTAIQLNVAQTTVSQWKRRGRVSGKQALALSAISRVSVHRLRPDLFGPPRRSR